MLGELESYLKYNPPSVVIEKRGRTLGGVRT